jgi:aminoglycoside phosphotransferase family enzyme
VTAARELARKLAFLRDPRSYPHRPARVTAIETHFAWVFLAGAYAYKLKKPARQSGMDYRTLAARRRGCQAELRLNRRLAAPVYLAVVPLTRQGGRFRLDGRGRTADYLVKMRRLPATASLERPIAAAALRWRDLQAVVMRLAQFHRAARRKPMPPGRYVARLATGIRCNVAALRPFRARIDWARVLRIARWQQAALRRHARAIGARGAQLVDGHGDLRAEHVYLRPLVIIDCLEFDADLRRLDPHDDVALLALGIARRQPALARRFLRGYAAALRDPIPPWLAHLYLSQRAFTRAKLAAWHLDEAQFPDPAPWLARADDDLRVAERHARGAMRAATPA